MTTPVLATTAQLLSGYLAWQQLERLAAETARAVLALLALLGRGLTYLELRRAVVEVLVVRITQAEALGRVAGVRDAARPVDGVTDVPGVVAVHRPAPADFAQRSALAPPLTPAERRDPFALPVRDDELRDRLTLAVDTLLAPVREQFERAEPADADRVSRVVEALAVQTPRIERLARDEPVQAAQRGYQDGIRAASTPEVQGYRRRVNPDCCELCYWLWKEGFVYPIDQPMHRHTGCRCVPVPTTDPVGRWKLSDADQQLYDDLYAKYSADPLEA